MKKQMLFGICTCMLMVGLAQAVDNSGRNSHFWITLQPQAGTASGSDADLVCFASVGRWALSVC